MGNEEFTEQPDGRFVSGPDIDLGPPDKPRGLQFLVIGIIVTVGVLAVALFINRGEGEGLPEAGPPQRGTSPSPVPSINPLEQPQLHALATSVAQRYYTGDGEVASSMIIHAESLTHCELQGYTGGRSGASLADPAERDFIRRDADAKGWDIAFGKYKGQWLVIAQACGEGT